jgi:uncharacterized caspase-like protein
MKTGSTYRDVILSEEQPSRDAQEGRAYIAVIGIDRYHPWNRLYNAVSDARGVLKVFAGLGFDLVAPPLFDECATGDALRRLVVDDLSGLSESDSLILFFAGHGHTITRTVGGTSVRDGYLIPADGDGLGGRAGTWIRLEAWLTDVTRIPAKHILVILDACHSGLALGPIVKWRSRGMEHGRREPLEQLRARRSRRIITSALDDQLAMDSGPVPGHSLFTGCLIEAMRGGLVASTGYQTITGSEIGHYVQRRVSEYPGAAQTPDFGALELDDRGELLVHIRREGAGETQNAAADATIEGPVIETTQRAVGSARLSRRVRYLGISGGMVTMIVGGVAALFATRHTASVEDLKPSFGRLSDAGVGVVTLPDGTLAVAISDAAQPVVIDVPKELGPLNMEKKNLRQPSRRMEDANLPEDAMPTIDPNDRGN